MSNDSNKKATTDMRPVDWEDIAESEFIDVVNGKLTNKIGFVFEHPDIGLHGFEYQPKNAHLRGVTYERQEGDE